MTYDTTVTSKGTITIAAPLRKAFNIKPGQKLRLGVSKDNKIVLDSGTDMQDFIKLRQEVTKSIPPHLKGLSGQALRDAAAEAWSKD